MGIADEGTIIQVRDKNGIPVEYYVHYKDFDRRLDEWVPTSRLDLNKFYADKTKSKQVLASPGGRKRFVIREPPERKVNYGSNCIANGFFCHESWEYIMFSAMTSSSVGLVHLYRWHGIWSEDMTK